MIKNIVRKAGMTTLWVLTLVGSAFAQEAEKSRSVASSESPVNLSAEEVSTPYTARIEVDSREPVSYGDEVNISVWITPHQTINLDSVKIHPKGNLSSIYVSKETVHKDLTDEAMKETEEGVTCRTSERSYPPGIPFVVRCDLVSSQTGLQQWLDPEILLGSGRQRFEIEVALRGGQGELKSFHEIGSVDFVSPKAAVVLGGFLGSLVLSFLTFVSRPVAAVPTAATWKDFGRKLWGATPQVVTSLSYGTWDVVRRALLGGVTAMVLIILAKSSEGFEAPISLRIQDFWGGLLVGLVSVNLANWVLKRLDSLVK